MPLVPFARSLTGLLLTSWVVAATVVCSPSAWADDGVPGTSPTTPTIPSTGPTTPTLATAPSPEPAATAGPTGEPSATTPTVAATPGTDPATSVVPTTLVPAGPAVPSTVRRRPQRRGPADLVTIDPGASGPARIEVDISAQRLLLYRGRSLYRTLHISTGSGRRYCVKGDCAIARTPRGRFRVYTRINGWRTSRLGQLYNPLYFNGGYAIHGAGSVPAYPASHGCVRISMANARWLPSAVPNGTPVWVHD